MILSQLRSLALVFGTALCGAGLFWLIGFPSAPLTGTAAAVSVAAVLGLRVALPGWLQTLAFVLLGINIGNGVTPDMLRTAATWPLSIALLAVALLAGMVIARIGLERWMGFDRRSATLAAAPGHLSFVLSLSLDSGLDTPRIAIVQSIRVLFLSLVIPVGVASAFGATGVDFRPTEVLAPGPGLALLAVTLAVGVVFRRLRFPAAYLLAGMCCSALAHGFDLVPGRLPDPLTFAAFLVMGTLIGSRFSGQSWTSVKSSVAAGLWLTLVNVAVTMLAVVAALLLLGLSPALLIVAFAPGGVEAMAAIAVTLGLDPAFVAAHHVMRLLLLTFIIPFLLRGTR